MIWASHPISERLGKEQTLPAGLCGYYIPVTFDPLHVADCYFPVLVGERKRVVWGRWWGAGSQHTDALRGSGRYLGSSLFWLSIWWRAVCWHKHILPLRKCLVASCTSEQSWFSEKHFMFSWNLSPSDSPPWATFCTLELHSQVQVCPSFVSRALMYLKRTVIPETAPSTSMFRFSRLSMHVFPPGLTYCSHHHPWWCFSSSAPVCQCPCSILFSYRDSGSHQSAQLHHRTHARFYQNCEALSEMFTQLSPRACWLTPVGTLLLGGQLRTPNFWFSALLQKCKVEVEIVLELQSCCIFLLLSCVRSIWGHLKPKLLSYIPVCGHETHRGLLPITNCKLTPWGITVFEKERSGTFCIWERVRI